MISAVICEVAATTRVSWALGAPPLTEQRERPAGASNYRDIVAEYFFGKRRTGRQRLNGYVISGVLSLAAAAGRVVGSDAGNEKSGGTLGERRPKIPTLSES